MPETIRDKRILPAPPSVKIGISPQPGSQYNYTLAGITYPYSTGPVSPPSYQFSTNTILTFTALVAVDYGVFVLDYHWKFGDGTEAYGISVDHTYVAASPETRVTLCVTDNYRREICAGRIVNLYRGTLVVVT